MYINLWTEIFSSGIYNKFGKTKIEKIEKI